MMDAIIDGAGAALAECDAAGLLQPVGGLLRFRHELARQSVLSACDPLRVAALHGAVFDALSQRGAPTSRLVHHAEHAGLTAATLRLAPLAAREATRAGAHRQAAAHCALALSHAGALGGSQQADLYLAHARACISMHWLDEALQSRRQALALHRQMEQPLAEGIDLRELARIEWFRGAIAEGKALAVAALDLLSRQQAPRQLALAQATMAHLHLFDAVPSETLEWGRQALAWFETHDDEEGACYALSIVAAAELIRDDQPASWRLLERSLQIALRRDLPEPVARIQAVVASLSILHRRFDRLHAACDAGIAYCDARDRDLDGARLRVRRAAGWIEQGDWPAARAELLPVRATPGRARLEDEQSRHLQALLDLRCGNDAAAAYWTQVIDGHFALSVDPWYAPQAPAAAEAAWLRGDRDATARIARDALPAALRTGERWHEGQLACWLRRCGEPVKVAVDCVAPPCQLELGVDVRAAAAAWGRLGCRYEQAMALLGGDAAALRDALALFDALGALPAARLARHRLRALGARDVPRGRYSAARSDPLGLTSRERTVLELVRSGMSNREIAQRLHRSERTVEHHVSALLAKSGVASRAELMPGTPEK